MFFRYTRLISLLPLILSLTEVADTHQIYHKYHPPSRIIKRVLVKISLYQTQFRPKVYPVQPAHLLQRSWNQAEDWSAPIVGYLQELASAGKFSGAVLLAQNEDILLKEAFGLADRSSGIPNQVDTRFNLGSINKMFTAIAILQLVEQGRLSVDNTI